MANEAYRDPDGTARQDHPPIVEQRAAPPSGNIPRGRQVWVSIAVALVIVLAVVFSGSTTTARRTPTAPQIPVHATSKAEIDRYRQALAEEEARLALARDQAARARTDYNAMNRAVDQGIPGQAVIGPNGQPYYPTTPQEPPVDPLEQERLKREYQSLFASNVALSYRPKAVTVAQKSSETASAPPVDASVSEKTEKPVASAQAGHKLFEGTILETVLTNRLEGAFAGPVNCQLTTDVYSHNGQHLLIPKGSRILGEAKRVADQDQQRLAVVFHRLIMPDGYSVSLDQMLGLDQAGASALKDKVNKHYLSTFGTSIALGLLAGFSMYGTGGMFTADGSDLYRQGVANQLGRDSQRILSRQLNRLPDITIREGHRVKILLSGDLSLPAYNQHPPTPGL